MHVHAGHGVYEGGGQRKAIVTCVCACLCMSMHVHAGHGTYVGGGQRKACSSGLFPPCRFQGTHSTRQAWQQVPFATHL